MCVTERDGERVGSIADRRLREGEQPRDHMGNLCLLRTAGADDRELHGTRSIFVEGRAGLDGRERCAARLAELERAVDIAVDEHALDGNRVRRQRLDDAAHFDVDAAQTLSHRQPIDLDAAGTDVESLRPTTIDDAEAGAARSGIES